MPAIIDNRFKYFKDINESLKRKYDTAEDFPYNEMSEAIDNIPTGEIPLTAMGIDNSGFFLSSDSAKNQKLVLGENENGAYITKEVS